MLQKRKLISLLGIALTLIVFIFLCMFLHTWSMINETGEFLDTLRYLHSVGLYNNNPVHFVVGPNDVGSRCFVCDLLKSTENSQTFVSALDMIEGTKFDTGISGKSNKN